MLDIRTFDAASAVQFSREYERIFYRGDYVAMASVYTTDAILMAQDTESIRGRDRIERFWKSACERAKAANLKRKIHHETLERSEELGFMRGKVYLTIPMPGEKTNSVIVKYVTVWRREGDGIWRMVVDISNRNAPPDANQHTYGVNIAEGNE